MIQKKSDDAVSPVIGVMLMIVIVVIIAAVVTAFATGMMSETEAAPVAALDVKIYDYYQALDDVGGPDFHITHLSGDPVDTRDIELRFSWTDSCGESHYSTYSADGMKEEHQNGIESPSGNGNRKQALYVKTPVTDDMRKDYGSSNLNYYFGDVVLTPGMKLTATADFLTANTENTYSPFMDAIFDNYDITGGLKYSKIYNVPQGSPTPHDIDTCQSCQVNINGYPPYLPANPNWDPLDPNGGCIQAKAYQTYLTYQQGICQTCNHEHSLCTAENEPATGCACATNDPNSFPTVDNGVMNHLSAGTAVDVMIIHTPSNKAIYEKTVVVQ